MTNAKKLRIAKTIGSYLINPIGLSFMLLSLGIVIGFFPASLLGLSIGVGIGMILGAIIAPLGALIYFSALAAETYRNCKQQKISFRQYISKSFDGWVNGLGDRKKEILARGICWILGFGLCLSILFAFLTNMDALVTCGESLLKALTHLSGLHGLEFLAPLASMAVAHAISMTLLILAPLVFAIAIQKIIGSCVPDDAAKEDTEVADVPEEKPIALEVESSIFNDLASCFTFCPWSSPPQNVSPKAGDVHDGSDSEDPDSSQQKKK